MIKFPFSAILDSTAPTSTDGQKLRKEIWEYSLLDVLILVFKHDYSIIEGQWMTAARLTTIFRFALKHQTSNYSCSFNEIKFDPTLTYIIFDHMYTLSST